MDIFISFVATLFIIFIVPIIVYGVFSKHFGVKEPEKKFNFFAGVLLEKIGTAAGFVGLFFLGRQAFAENWFWYGFLWFGMFAITEIGQIYRINSPKKEALAGIISEAIYFPLVAYIIVSILT